MKNTLLIILLIFNLNSFSQGSSPETDSAKTEKTNINPGEKNKENQKILTELDYYRLLAEQSESNNNSFKSLMHWSLGISFAFLLAIIGSQIFFNYRINKKEIDFIKKDLDEKTAELKNTLSENIDSKFEKLKEELKKDILRSSVDMKKNLSENFKSQREYAALKMEATKTSLKQDLKHLENEIKKNTGDLWKIKGVKANALTNFIRSAEIQIDLKREVKYILNDIIEILKQIEEIHLVDVNALETLIEKIKATHTAQVAEIKKLYIDKPVYEFVPNDKTTGLVGAFASRKKYIKNEMNKK
jgi:hypothetical protein